MQRGARGHGPCCVTRGAVQQSREVWTRPNPPPPPNFFGGIFHLRCEGFCPFFSADKPAAAPALSPAVSKIVQRGTQNQLRTPVLKSAGLFRILVPVRRSQRRQASLGATVVVSLPASRYQAAQGENFTSIRERACRHIDSWMWRKCAGLGPFSVDLMLHPKQCRRSGITIESLLRTTRPRLVIHPK